MKGILLADNGDLAIKPVLEKDGIRSGIIIGGSEIQNASIVLGMNQGELKEDPLIGPNLLRFIRAKATKTAVIRQVRIHLERDGLDYDELKERININLKNI